MTISKAAATLLSALQTAKDDSAERSLLLVLSDIEYPISVGHIKAPAVYLKNVGELVNQVNSDPTSKVKLRPIEQQVGVSTGLCLKVEDGVELFISYVEVPRIIEILSTGLATAFEASMLVPAEKKPEASNEA